MNKVEDELYQSYFEYSKYVIEERALPSITDGFKSVHRRILYTMHTGGVNFNDKKVKSAKIIGDVFGKYHPHSNDAIYGALVGMAQNFVRRERLVIGQGNFGSIDGDNAAAMRYTEARLSKYSAEFFKDFYTEINPMKMNYDGTLSEPENLPCRSPNLLINGSQGIAVGISTSIPPHNLNEVIDAAIYLIDNPEGTVADLMQFVKGPDAPTGGILSGAEEIKEAYETGESNLKIRANYFFEEDYIIFDEVPYMVKKGDVMKQLATGITQGNIEGVSSIKDESDMKGIRIALKIKQGYTKEIIVNQVYSHTSLKTGLRFCFFALNEKKEPRMYNLKSYLNDFLKFREKTVVKRTLYFKEKNRKRMHLLIGLSVAIENLDEITKSISKCNDIGEARQFLNSKKWSCKKIQSYLSSMGIGIGEYYELSPEQTKNILDLKLHNLVRLEISKIENELDKLKQEIETYNFILNDKNELKKIIKEELTELKTKYHMPRKTIIEDSFSKFNKKDLVTPEEIVIIMDKNNYVKRVSLANYQTQNKGGMGRSGSKEEIEDTVMASTHSLILMFSNFGLVYAIYGYEIPEGSHNTKGRAMINLINIKDKEKIIKSIVLSQNELQNPENLSLMFVYKNGQVRRNGLDQFINIRSNGKKYLKDCNDISLVSVLKSKPGDFLFLGTHNGMASCIPVEKFRIFGSRDSQGVIGCKLKDKDYVIGAINCNSLEENILTISEKGIGKISALKDYRTTNRGSIGVRNLKVNEKSGKVVGIMNVNNDDEVLVTTKKSNFLRFAINKLRVYGRNTTGLKLCNLKKDDQVTLIKKVSAFESATF